MQPMQIGRVVTARILHAGYDLRELANKHGNWDGSKNAQLPLWAAIVKNGSTTDRKLMAACEKLKIEFLRVYRGWAQSKWQKRHAHKGRPVFHGIVIHAMNYNRLVRAVCPERMAALDEARREAVYNNNH